jgi:hypothetical protein
MIGLVPEIQVSQFDRVIPAEWEREPGSLCQAESPRGPGLDLAVFPG